MINRLSESPAILDAAQRVYFRSTARTQFPRSKKFPPLYDEFVGIMWRMPHLIELRVHGIGDLPASLVDFLIHNRTLEQLTLSDVTIPPPAFHLQKPPLSYRYIQADNVTGDIEPLFSNSSSTLQRLEIGFQFPIKVISFLSHAPTNTMSSLVELKIRKYLTEEQASWFVRFLPRCPVLERLSILGKFPLPMSLIPVRAVPMLRSLRADEDGHALVLLNSPIRRISSLTLTLRGPRVFHFLQVVHSQPIYISGEIAYACLTRPNNNFHRLVQNCERFHGVVVPSSDPVTEVRGSFPENCVRLPFTGQIAPTAHILTLMPSLKDISITFRLPWYSNDFHIAKSLKKPRALQLIQHWQKQADQSCPHLQHITIKIDIAGHNHPCFVFNCTRREQDQSMTWEAQIWREHSLDEMAGGTRRQKTWIVTRQSLPGPDAMA